MIYLYKLHGSVNWYNNAKKEIISTNIPEEKADSLIIVPGNSKFQSSYNSPYLEMISRFREALLETDLLIIIGYSFNDDHINNIIEEIGKRNQRLHLLVCKYDEKKCAYMFDGGELRGSLNQTEEEKKYLGNLENGLGTFGQRLSIIQCKDIF